MAKREYNFWVYLMASRSHQLYVGITNDLMRRVAEHKRLKEGAYTADYRIDRLVHFQHFMYVNNAIAREKVLKDWNRAKKIELIESINPTWMDLSEDWGASLRRLHGMGGDARDAVSLPTAGSSASLRNDNQKAGTKTENVEPDARAAVSLPTAGSSASLRNDNQKAGTETEAKAVKSNPQS